MSASTLISLRVTQCRTVGASAGTITSVQAVNRATASGRSHRSSPNHAGWVKWCRVTSGVSPRSAQAAAMAA